MNNLVLAWVFCCSRWFSGFLEFSRNRLVGDESPPDDTSILCYFWVLEEEPPGGISLAARRHMAATQILGFWVELPGYAEHPLGDASWFGMIFTFLVFWEDSNRGETMLNGLGMVRHHINLKFLWWRIGLIKYSWKWFYGSKNWDFAYRSKWGKPQEGNSVY